MRCCVRICPPPSGYFALPFCLSVSLSTRPLTPRYSPALRGALGAGLPSCVLRFRPFLTSFRCFHFLECSGSWAGASLAGPGAVFPDRLCLRDQTCSQIWSTVFRFGWSTNCMKSLYHSFWLVDCPWLVCAGLRGLRTEGAGPAKGKISSVIARRVWVNPCSIAWHWYTPPSLRTARLTNRPRSVCKIRSSRRTCEHTHTYTMNASSISSDYTDRRERMKVINLNKDTFIISYQCCLHPSFSIITSIISFSIITRHIYPSLPLSALSHLLPWVFRMLLIGPCNLGL